MVTAVGLLVLTSNATSVSEGINSRASSSRFGPTPTFNWLTPVTLPPGRLMLATKPICTGSLLVVKTIGIVSVAAFAIRFAGVFATITETWRPARSAAISSSRS
jgi:hypothetical protein